MEKTNTQIAENLEHDDNTTWRKWSREFLDPDPSAGQRKGVARTYSAEKAFLVWVGSRLVTEKKMTYREAKQSIDVLEGFLKDKGYIPLQDTPSRHETDNYSWDFEITRKQEGSTYTAQGTQIIGHKGSNPEEGIEYTEKRKAILLSDNGSGEPICTTFVPIQPWINDFFLLVWK